MSSMAVKAAAARGATCEGSLVADGGPAPSRTRREGSHRDRVPAVRPDRPEGIDFCESCGAFLEWEGEARRPRPGPAPDPPPALLPAPPPPLRTPVPPGEVAGATGLDGPSGRRPPAAARTRRPGRGRHVPRVRCVERRGPPVLPPLRLGARPGGAGPPAGPRRHPGRALVRRAAPGRRPGTGSAPAVPDPPRLSPRAPAVADSRGSPASPQPRPPAVRPRRCRGRARRRPVWPVRDRQPAGPAVLPQVRRRPPGRPHRRIERAAITAPKPACGSG